jgi:hypothetical protein
VLAADQRPHARALLEAPDALVEIARPQDQMIDVDLGRAGVRRHRLGEGPVGQAEQGQEEALHPQTIQCGRIPGVFP